MSLATNVVIKLGPYRSMKNIIRSIITTQMGHQSILQTDNNLTLYLFEWQFIEYEFRVFVKNNTVIAISQQHYNDGGGNTDNTRTLSDEALRKMGVICIQAASKFRSDSIFDYAADVGILKNGYGYPIEPNSWGGTTSPALFSWDELNAMPTDGLPDIIVRVKK
jgi:hypothetical protein